MSSAAASLHSDHINLLIFRYLQESGFENAALALASDWHRPKECRDPERLPFAHEVRRNELVSVLQIGLYHDELQARVTKGGRRFRWTGIDARESIERQDDRMENGAGSRPVSNTKRKGRPAVMRPPDDFPTPAPKRQRKSEGSEGQLNGDGDAMDVDAASADADAEDDPDAVSPTAPSEQEVEITDRYDSMEIATQTDIKIRPRTSAMEWTVDVPNGTCMQSTWCPSSTSRNAKTLLAVGESLCRYYSVPDSMDDTVQIDSKDIDSIVVAKLDELEFISELVDSTVTAAAWRPDGEEIACAIDGPRDLPNVSTTIEQGTPQQILFQHKQDTDHCRMLKAAPSHMHDYSIICSIKYSPDSRYMLTARANAESGEVQVWRTAKSDDYSSDEVAWRVFDNPVSDVTWISNDTFVACGCDGLSAIYQVDEAYDQQDQEPIAETTEHMRGLMPQNASIFTFSHMLDHVVVDNHLQIAIFSSSESKKLFLTQRLHNQLAHTEHDHEVDIPEALIALHLAPSRHPENEKENEDASRTTRLAVALEDGSCIVYSITKSGDFTIKYNEDHALNLSKGPALALQWSPDGEFLAVANEDIVQIWAADSHSPIAIWEPSRSPDAHLMNGVDDSEKPMAEPSLSWSADGESLAFAVGKKMAVLRFTPSLRGQAQDHEQNPSP